MITVEGLSKRQRVFADIIWGLNSQAQVDAFIQTLPKAQKLEAEAVVEMLILAVIDEVDTIDEEVVEMLNEIGRQ
jgi:vacuolar-type H+-ATPase subunit I/STV1